MAKLATEEVVELATRSQQLLEAALVGDVAEVEDRVGTSASASASAVDVNYVGTVNLKFRCVETLLHEESADEVRIIYQEFRTDVTALFAAAHSGHADIVKRLLSAGADVNQKLFCGYATTAAARQGHCDILDMLLKAGASQEACEDALLEAGLCGEAEVVKLLICSDMVRPDIMQHVLVNACSRGFAHVVTELVEHGVDMSCSSRVLLRSIKPTVHVNVDCTPLVAAVLSRQVFIVKYLLEAGAKTNSLVRVGAWSWDPISGEELRVGACLGDPYSAVWCAVEYYEASGEILKLLLCQEPSLLETPNLGRTPLLHAILCQNPNAVDALLVAGANPNFRVRAKNGFEFYPIHLAARLGSVHIIRHLVSHGSDVNVRTSTGETSLMISAKSDNSNCFLELLTAGADLGLISNAGDTAIQLARGSGFSSSIISFFCKALTAEASICSSDLNLFSPLHFAAQSGNCELLQMILRSSTAELNKLDGLGFTPLMVAVKAGHSEAFRLLIMAGADINEQSSDGLTVISILQSEESIRGVKDCFEKILLDAVLANVLTNHTPFRALHCAAQKGFTSSVVQLIKMGYPIDALDENGYSPLMLAAVEGHSNVCKLLLQRSANCQLMNDKKETALTLAKKSSRSNKATESIILDHLASYHVLSGEELNKHTREGRGLPHIKTVRMLKSGVLTWGKSYRRNILCKEAAAGPSLRFMKNRGKGNESSTKWLFHVVSNSGEVHFDASSASSLELWVRGINLLAGSPRG